MKRTKNIVRLLLAFCAGTLSYAISPQQPLSLPNTQTPAILPILNNSPQKKAAITAATIRGQIPSSLVRSGLNAISPINNAYQNLGFNLSTGLAGLGNRTKIPLAFVLGKMGHFKPTPGQSNYEKFSGLISALMIFNRDKILAAIPRYLSHYVAPDGAVARALETLNPTQSLTNVLWGAEPLSILRPLIPKSLGIGLTSSGSEPIKKASLAAVIPFRWAFADRPTWSSVFYQMGNSLSQIGSSGGDWIKRSGAQLVAWALIAGATAYALKKIGQMTNLTNNELKQELTTASNAISSAQMVANPEEGILTAEKGLELETKIAEYADLLAAFGERNMSLSDQERSAISGKHQEIVDFTNNLLSEAIENMLKENPKSNSNQIKTLYKMIKTTPSSEQKLILQFQLGAYIRILTALNLQNTIPPHKQQALEKRYYALYEQAQPLHHQSQPQQPKPTLMQTPRTPSRQPQPRIYTPTGK